MRNTSFLPCLLVLVVLPLGARAGSKNPDPHFASASLGALSQDSAFVHGYLHGYEEGFHTADLRLYAPRLVFNPPDMGNKDAKAYRQGFGDKKFFREGFRYGFRSGYADGISGRSFRALALVRDTLGSDSPAGGGGFDRALALGYFTGRKDGLRDGRLWESFRPQGVPCNPAEVRLQAPGFCEWLEQGYRMGYTDGYQNQYDRPEAQTASR